MSGELSAGELCLRLLGRPHEPSYAGRLGAAVMCFMAVASMIFVAVGHTDHAFVMGATAIGFVLVAVVLPGLPWLRLPRWATLVPVVWMYALLTIDLAHAGSLLGPFLVLYPLIGLYLGLTQLPWTSVCLLPLAATSIVIGVLASGHASYFLAASLAVAVSGACGDSLALVVQRDAVSRERLESLLGVCSELASARSVSEAADLVAELTGRLLGADNGMVLLNEAPGSSVLVMVGTYRIVVPDSLFEIDWAKSESGIAQAMKSGEPLFVQDAQSSPFLKQSWLERMNVSSVLYVPIRGEDGQVGLVAAVWSTSRPRFDHDARRIVEVLSGQAGPVLERLRTNRRLAHESQTDALTELPNRRALAGALGRLPVGGCLVFLDLDHFKELNDAYGHAAGDTVLSAFGRMLREQSRDDLDVAIRTGGEEFVIIIPDATLEGCSAIIQRLRSAWEENIPPVTFSAGVARRRPREEPMETLARADDALYQAKRTGRNRTVADLPDSGSATRHRYGAMPKAVRGEV